MNFNKNLNIYQARNLIACGFGIGVRYGCGYYIMNKNHNFDYRDAYNGADSPPTNYMPEAFVGIETLKLCQEVPWDPQ